MKISRKKHTSVFKAKVAIEAIKEKLTIREIASKFEVHPTQINLWKKEFLKNATVVFDKKKGRNNKETDPDKLYSKIGQLQVELDFLKRVLGK